MTSRRPLADFLPGDVILARDPLQPGYAYELASPPGADFDPGFAPELDPGEMLRLGVFGGAYFGEEAAELPEEWIREVRASADGTPDPGRNAFSILAAQTREEWIRRGWILPGDPDPRGWFQWYCRYWLGRRHAVDARQIRRWRAFARHAAQIRRNCAPGDLSCRRRQRQAILQWAYDPLI